MSVWSASLALNTLAGILLVLVGALVALRSKSRFSLALFFMAWGAQLSLNNIAADSASAGTAFLLYLLAELFLPLQGMLLLHYVSEEAGRLAAPRIYATCRWASIAAFLCVLVGAILTVTVPSQILSVTSLGDGTHAASKSTLDYLFFKAPQALGVALALILLAGHVASRPLTKPWLLVVGLCFAWAYYLGYALADELFPNLQIAQDPNLLLSGILLVSFASIAILAPLILASQAHDRKGLLALLVPLACALAFVPHYEGPAQTWLSPGLFRILALALLVPALWERREAPLDERMRGRIVPIGVAVTAVIVAVIIVALSALSPNAFGAAGKLYASGLAVASLVLIGAMSSLEVGPFLLRRPA